MKLYSNMYDYAVYTPSYYKEYYEHKYLDGYLNIYLFAHFKHTVKPPNHCAYMPIIIIITFSLMYMRMNGKNINFDDKE